MQPLKVICNSHFSCCNQTWLLYILPRRNVLWINQLLLVLQSISCCNQTWLLYILPRRNVLWTNQLLLVLQSISCCNQTWLLYILPRRNVLWINQLLLVLQFSLLSYNWLLMTLVERTSKVKCKIFLYFSISFQFTFSLQFT